MEYITLEMLIRTMHESQEVHIFDVTDNNVGSIEDICTGIATWGKYLYTGKIQDMEYSTSKDFDGYKVTDFFSTSHDSITIKVVRIPNFKMSYSPKNGFEVSYE